MRDDLWLRLQCRIKSSENYNKNLDNLNIVEIFLLILKNVEEM